jgi:hypothetical protein
MSMAESCKLHGHGYNAQSEADRAFCTILGHGKAALVWRGLIMGAA